MSPRLRVLAGTSTSNLSVITDLVNTPKAFDVSSDMFQGEIVTHIKGLTDEEGNIRNSDYFERDDRSGITWSIQVQGRFLEPLSTDDILFGNIFDRPLRLPWGTGAVLKFMQYLDPTLEHDLSSSRPWALSPLISSMPHFAHKRLGKDSTSEEFPASASVLSEDSIQDLYLAVVEDSNTTRSLSHSSSTSSLSSESTSTNDSMDLDSSRGYERSDIADQIQQLKGVSERRAFFSIEKNRKAVAFGPEDIIAIDFCYGFINFTPTLSLQVPVGPSFDLMRYWDRQPLRFVCCKRRENGASDGDPWGKVIWCIAIECVED